MVGVTDLLEQIFHGPGEAAMSERFRGVTVSPNGVAGCFQGLRLQFRLGKQPAKETGKHIAAAALREIWIAAGIHKDLASVPADHRLVPFEHDPAVPVFARNFAHGSDSILLHHAHFRSE